MFCLLVRRLGILQFNSWLSAFSFLERPLLVDAVVQYLLYYIIGADLLGFWFGTEFFTIFLAPKFIKDSVPFVKDSVPFIKDSVPFIKDSVPFINKSVPKILYRTRCQIFNKIKIKRKVVNIFCWFDQICLLKSSLPTDINIFDPWVDSLYNVSICIPPRSCTNFSMVRITEVLIFLIVFDLLFQMQGKSRQSISKKVSNTWFLKIVKLDQPGRYDLFC